MGIGRNAVPQQGSDNAPILQWANGITKVRDGRSTRNHVGFHIERGKWHDLDDALDEVQHPVIAIQHQRDKGTEVVEHWDLGEKIRFLPITSGPVDGTVRNCIRRAHEMAEAGLGVRWVEHSQFAVRGFVDVLWNADITTVVQLSTKSNMTDYLLGALINHTRAAVAADELVRAKNPDAIVSPADLWLPLGAGPEVAFGREKATMVYPIVSLHIEDFPTDHLRSCWRKKEVAEAVLKHWPQVQAWAREFCAYDPSQDARGTRSVNEQTGEVEDDYQPIADRRSYGRH